MPSGRRARTGIWQPTLPHEQGSRRSCLTTGWRPSIPFPQPSTMPLASYRSLLDAGLSPDRIVVAGDSAGGGLTVSCLLAARDAGLADAGRGRMPVALDRHDRVRRQLSRQGGRRCPGGAGRSRLAMASAYLGKPRSQRPRWPRRPSPIFRGFRPCLFKLAVTKCCSTMRVCWRPRPRRRASSHSSKNGPDMIHVWQWYWPVLEEGRQANAALASFFKTHLAKGRA